MNTENYKIRVSGLSIDVIQKPIKNLHLAVYPPHGRIRVAAPLTMSKESIRLAVIDKYSWIKKQKLKFEEQPRQSKRDIVSGESHYFLGQRYRLKLVKSQHSGLSILQGKSILEFHTSDKISHAKREKILFEWYRQQLRDVISPLVEQWSKKMDLSTPEWSIRKMKTKWGSCNTENKKISFNLELAKKPIHWIEYVVVHELAHLYERNHNDKFVALLNKYLAHWRQLRKELNNSMLGHEEWSC